MLLSRWHAGDDDAGREVTALVYPMLRAMAQQALAAGGGRLTLDATELAHEVYLRLLQQDRRWHNRGHMLAIIAQALRRVVVDLIRYKQAQKRDSGGPLLELDATAAAVDGGQVRWLALDEALTALEARDPVAARIVEWRYFGGMSNDEIARELGIGVATVGRHWRFARAWLHAVL
ncbi:ECF-type sigma factor [Luteimonas sp. R10]|uniref:ECF-type sigma factor n=1 Tax=Luteimonas sp. R10 TaxID=3108176 RepID=UPI003087FC24|nr:ECF-type sigma factor [Luteimonas sp. R10]